MFCQFPKSLNASETPAPSAPMTTASRRGRAAGKSFFKVQLFIIIIINIDFRFIVFSSCFVSMYCHMFCYAYVIIDHHVYCYFRFALFYFLYRAAGKSFPGPRGAPLRSLFSCFMALFIYFLNYVICMTTIHYNHLV